MLPVCNSKSVNHLFPKKNLFGHIVKNGNKTLVDDFPSSARSKIATDGYKAHT